MLGTVAKDLLPEDAGLTAHCRRVSALATEVARGVRLTPDGVGLLQQAALLHHVPSLLLDPAAVGRLMLDVVGGTGEYGVQTPVISSDIAVILRMLHSRFQGAGAEQLRKIAAILQLSDLVDVQIQMLVYDDCTHAAIWDGLEQICEFTLF